MIEQVTIVHHIQKYIIGVLIHQKYARFRDLRPPKTDTNLFSYHLKLLLKVGFIEKGEYGYTLSRQGLAHADRVSVKKLNIRTQPKIITMTALRDKRGYVLLQRRVKQPYIDTWTLPYGKIHIDDVTVEVAAQREVKEKLGLDGLVLTHVGDSYIRVQAEGDLLSSTLAHVFTGRYDHVFETENVVWKAPDKLRELSLAPAVERIIQDINSQKRFFSEITEDWQLT